MPIAKVPVNMTMTLELYDAVKQAAAARGLGVATYIRELVVRELSYTHKPRVQNPKKRIEPWEIDESEYDPAARRAS